MGLSYYYFAATLPSLRFGEPPPMTVRALLDRTEEYLPAHDHDVLAAAATGDPAALAEPDVQRWTEWDTDLRRILAAARAARLGRDASAYADTGMLDTHTRAAVLECIKLDDPLKAEQALDRLRWQFLDELAATHVFDFTAALSYLLKLTLLERWHQLDAAHGAAVLDRSVHARAGTTMEESPA
jgi:hypothetical protein